MSDEVATKNQPEVKESSWLDRVISKFSGAPENTDDLIALIDGARENQIVGDMEVTMVRGVFELNALRVKEVMVPRGKINGLTVTSTPNDILEMVREQQHSRYPVFAPGMERAEGILIVKDLLELLYHSKANELPEDWLKILRKPMYVPETMRLNTLLKEFRQQRNHLALVVDEFDNLAGLITLEDVLEVIVGDIEDEHDDEEDMLEPFIAQGEGYIMPADVTLEEVNDKLGTQLVSDKVESLGGYFSAHLGHIPEVGNEIQQGSWLLTVIKADSRRALEIQATPFKPSEASDMDSAETP